MITCDKCNGLCCRRIAIRIEPPTSKSDFEDVKWYLYHENLSVYIDNEDDWLVLVPNKCKHLDSKGMCKIYDKRPPVCRNSKVSDCEKNIEETKIMFKTPEDLEKYRKSLS
jgi:uncharacterized protein